MNRGVVHNSVDIDYVATFGYIIINMLNQVRFTPLATNFLGSENPSFIYALAAVGMIRPRLTLWPAVT